jgi:hypothetical protein
MHYNVTVRRVHITFFFCWKAISITCSECVFVTWVIQHAMCMHRSAVCGLSDSTIFFHIISRTTRLSENFFQHKMYLLIFLYKFRRCISPSKELSKIWSIMCIVLHVNYPLLLSDFLKTSSFSVDLWEILIKFYGNPSSVSRVVPYGRGDGQVHRHGEANGRFSLSCKRAFTLYSILRGTCLITFHVFPQSSQNDDT